MCCHYFVRVRQGQFWNYLLPLLIRKSGLCTIHFKWTVSTQIVYFPLPLQENHSSNIFSGICTPKYSLNICHTILQIIFNIAKIETDLEIILWKCIACKLHWENSGAVRHEGNQNKLTRFPWVIKLIPNIYVDFVDHVFNYFKYIQTTMTLIIGF